MGVLVIVKWRINTWYIEPTVSIDFITELWINEYRNIFLSICIVSSSCNLIPFDRYKLLLIHRNFKQPLNSWNVYVLHIYIYTGISIRRNTIFMKINNFCAQCKCAETDHRRWKINFPRVFAIVQRWSVIFDGLWCGLLHLMPRNESCAPANLMLSIRSIDVGFAIYAYTNEINTHGINWLIYTVK